MSGKPPIQSIKVGPIQYEVEFVEDLRDDTGKLDGRIGYSQTRIQLDAGMNHQATVLAILHETIHAIIMHTGRPKVSRDEAFVDALAYGIFQVIHENPQLVKMITRKG